MVDEGLSPSKALYTFCWVFNGCMNHVEHPNNISVLLVFQLLSKILTFSPFSLNFGSNPYLLSRSVSDFYFTFVY